jgi:hypothetical protein
MLDVDIFICPTVAGITIVLGNVLALCILLTKGMMSAAKAYHSNVIRGHNDVKQTVG